MPAPLVVFTCELFMEKLKVEDSVAEGDDRISPPLVYSDSDLDLFWGEEADVPTEPIAAGVSCESSAPPVAWGEREEDSRLLENEECVLELMATPLSGLCRVFLTFAPAELAVGEPTDGAGSLRGLAADVVEGEAIEEGTGGVWGGTCN